MNIPVLHPAKPRQNIAAQQAHKSDCGDDDQPLQVEKVPAVAEARKAPLSTVGEVLEAAVKKASVVLPITFLA